MKRISKSVLSVFFAVITLQIFAAASSYSEIKPQQINTNEIKPVKYVFLFIGDGMSLPQRMTAEEFSMKTANKKLFINSMPEQAVTTTGSANAFVTDSAASGTAIACGEKTMNGTIGMDASRKNNIYSSAHLAKQLGRKVGIISSVNINHATPAAFYGHRPSRGDYYELGLDLVASDFDYFAGGRIIKYDDKENKLYKGNIYDLAREAGYSVSIDNKKLPAFNADTKKILHTSDFSALPYAIDNPDGEYVRLSDIVEHAIRFLDNDGKGFFIMAEGGKIDWVGHSNDAATNMREVIDFDNAVKVAYRFALKHPDETLIVVTGDHETGGLTLGFAGTGYKSNIEKLAMQKCSGDVLQGKIQALSAKDVVVFDDIKPILRENLNLTFPGDADADKALLLTNAEVEKLEKVFKRNFPEGKYKKSTALLVETLHIFAAKCSLSWTTGSHTALPVLTTAYGVNAELFSNFIDNTDIAKRLKSIIAK